GGRDRRVGWLCRSIAGRAAGGRGRDCARAGGGRGANTSDLWRRSQRGLGLSDPIDWHVRDGELGAAVEARHVAARLLNRLLGRVEGGPGLERDVELAHLRRGHDRDWLSVNDSHDWLGLGSLDEQSARPRVVADDLKPVGLRPTVQGRATDAGRNVRAPDAVWRVDEDRLYLRQLDHCGAAGAVIGG